MSALPDEQHPDDNQMATSSTSDQAVVAGTPVVIRRNAGLAALIGAGASGIAIAYLWRASQTGTVTDWALCLAMALIGVFYLTSFVDSRTPLVVADDLGVRIRLGSEWRGLPWDAVNQVVVQPRRGPLRDGRLIFSPRSLGRALDGLDARGRRQAALNQRLYGAAMAVPLGLTTRLSTNGDRALEDGIAALALGRANVVVLEHSPTRLKLRAESRRPVPDGVPTPDDPSQTAEPMSRDSSPAEHEVVTIDDLDDLEGLEALHGPEALDGLDGLDGLVKGAETGDDARQPRRSMLGGIGTIVSRVAKGRSHDLDSAPREAGSPATATIPAAANAVPFRTARPALRAQISRDLPATLGKQTVTTLGNAVLGADASDSARATSLPEGRELRRPGSVDLVFERADTSRVRPISQLGDPVEPLVVDDFVTEPAYDPVIGPELAAARTRVGLTVDELAERTRIRPHVIESIEVDDFAPCGGDFYARGHLRTLARVLGKDVDPLLKTFDQRYATAPINARRVFEAELATGMTGSMRSTIGGPNWGLLIGAVLMLVLVWGVVRLFGTQPNDQIQSPAPVLNGSAGIERTFPNITPVTKPLHFTLVATQADSRILVRDSSGKVVYAGVLAVGEKKVLTATPPVKVRAEQGGAIDVQIRGKDRGVIGEPGQPGHRTIHRPPSR